MAFSSAVERHVACTPAPMDPANPRWEASERRRQRSAAFWKRVVAATATAALSTVLIVSYLDWRDARRERERARDDEPGIVETTAAPAPGSSVTAEPTEAPPAAFTAAAAAPRTGDATVTAAAVTAAPPTGDATGDATVTAGEARPTMATPAPAPAPPTRSAAPVAAPPPRVPAELDAAPEEDAAPPGDQDGGPLADPPPSTGGAGRFVTEAPYWSSSAFPTNPEAGAGPFTTEHSAPAR